MDPRQGQPFDVTPAGRIKPKDANHSPLMLAMGRAELGQKVNFCPFGCTDEELDEHNYCDHLVGFTKPGNDKVFEPQVTDEKGERHVQGHRAEPVLPTDKLVRITVCSRVYRQLPAAPENKAKAKSA